MKRLIRNGMKQKKETMKTFNVYFAGDLFDHKHLTGNLLLAQSIEKELQNQYTCTLPQKTEGALRFAIDVRNRDLQYVAQADLVLFNFDGVDLDSGTVVEFMIAKMLDIPAVLLRTDFRKVGFCFDGGDSWNLMISGYPRCETVNNNALVSFNTLGMEQAHRSIAQSIINAFKNVVQKKSLMNSYEEIYAAYQHVVKMCGSQLEKKIDAQTIHAIITSKVEKGIYLLDEKPQKIEYTQSI